MAATAARGATVPMAEVSVYKDKRLASILKSFLFSSISIGMGTKINDLLG